jgi:nucleotide-binding universal stress UspA family protein
MTILLCFDGSDQSKHAIGVTGELFPGAQVHVLNVWEPVERIVARYAVLAPYMGEELGAADDSAQDASTATAAEGVELATAAGLHATAHTAKLVTTVWEAVVEVADALDAAVIITGTRSLHGVREIVSNTLSHSLIQHSARPVLAIPMPVS